MEREQRRITIVTYEDVLANPGLLGYVAGNDEDGYYAYGPPVEDDGRFHKLTTEPVETETLAGKILVDYINETIVGMPSDEA